MAKVTFLTFYTEYSIGVHVLSSRLEMAGHEPSVIFFKLEAKDKIEWFKKNPTFYEKVDTSGDIIGYNSDVKKWTEHELELLINKINDISPDLLCISSKTTDKDVLNVVVPEIKSRCDVFLIAGGFGPTLEPEFYTDLFDFIYIGEAENSIVELIETVQKGISLSKFNNIYYKKNGKLIKNRLNIPDFKQFRLRAMPEHVFYIENNTITGFKDRHEIISTHTYSTFIGKGCISSCSYCSAGNWNKLYKKEGIKLAKRRNRSLEDVLSELIEIKDKGYTFIFFRDEFLCADINYLKSFFEIYAREINLPFWAFLVPHQVLIHPELLELAVDAGFVDTEVGFQSGSDKINRRIFNRKISNKDTLDYVKLLSKYEINVKYDFIIFNPVETIDDIQKTFDLIQLLPKERAYLQLARLNVFPMSPIIDILKNYNYIDHNIEKYYCTALLYHLCFVMPKKEFDSILHNENLVSSWKDLKSLYQSYLCDNNIEFMIGTHEIPNSITTPRYRRILKKKGYKDIIVWGAGQYYNEMSDIFDDSNILYLIDDSKDKYFDNGYKISNPNVLKSLKNPIPIFICSKHKQEIKNQIIRDYPEYGGKIYV